MKTPERINSIRLAVVSTVATLFSLPPAIFTVAGAIEGLTLVDLLAASASIIITSVLAASAYRNYKKREIKSIERSATDNNTDLANARITQQVSPGKGNVSNDEKRRSRIVEKARQAQFDEDYQQKLVREGQTWQIIFLDTLAVILLALAVAIGLSLLAFPPTSGVFLGLAIATSVCLGCSAISKIWSYNIKQDMKKMPHQIQQDPAKGTSSDLIPHRPSSTIRAPSSAVSSNPEASSLAANTGSITGVSDNFRSSGDQQSLSQGSEMRESGASARGSESGSIARDSDTERRGSSTL